MLYTINELHNKVYENVNAVYDIFKNYFGEDSVDLQNIKTPENIINHCSGTHSSTSIEADNNTISSLRRYAGEQYPFILVHWPHVTITNEHNRSVNIQDLYAKITLTIEGGIPYEYTFQLNRSRYSMEQFLSFRGRGYLHSHIPGIPKDDFTRFQNPCLGSGPIRETIGTLKQGFNEVTWMLFCEELSRYVTVESLTGGPYMRMEDMGLREPLRDYNSGFSWREIEDYSLMNVLNSFKDSLGSNAIREFITYYLTNGHLSLIYKQGQFYCGLSFPDYIIDISNAFISFYNEKYRTNVDAVSLLYTRNIIRDTLIIENKFYETTQPTNSISVDSYRGRRVCTFKGQPVNLVIDDAPQSEAVSSVIINYRLAMYVLNRTLRVINYRYKNESNNQLQGGGAQGSASTTDQKVKYL